MLNSDIFQGKFKELTGEIKKKWGELTDDELQRTKGNLESLTGLIQQKYGIAKEKASEEISGLFERYKSNLQTR